VDVIDNCKGEECLNNLGSCRQIGEAGVVLVYYDPFELTTFQQEYGDDPVSHQSFAE
jgi:hypothetical protein